MSLLKKAHGLLMQARQEKDQRKATMLRKSSVQTYNEIIAFSFIYGVVTRDANPKNVSQAVSSGSDFNSIVAKLIANNLGLTGLKNFILASRLAREFFQAEDLSKNSFYEKMIKDFTFSLKSRDKAEDAVHNILAGLNPLTEQEYSRTEAKNQFAYAGKEHQNLPNLLADKAKELKVNRDSIIVSKYRDCMAAIFNTISLLDYRLKYHKQISVSPTSYEGILESEAGPSVELLTPSEDAFDAMLSNLSESSIENLIDLFQKGYGWKASKSNAQRRAIAHYFLSMMVHFEYNNLSSLISSREEKELLDMLSYSPRKIMDDGRVERDAKLVASLNKLIEMVSTSDSDFLDEVTFIYNDINPFDPITKSTGQRAFGTGWETFLDEISKDMKANETGEDLIVPSSSSQLERVKSFFKAGSKKNSMKSRVASLLKRYYQI